MHTKPYFDYKGRNISGFSYNSENATTSVMTFMINSISSSYKDVLHILPVNKIAADASPSRSYSIVYPHLVHYKETAEYIRTINRWSFDKGSSDLNIPIEPLPDVQPLEVLDEEP
ncbi:hypothetical protein HNY73_010795 [Argiope bruennichi]|uniref:Uncharacterized protein n=1 Tax=Argiope bruennichi TaxID=94029 RepID=A0A8T0F8A8_ARGBR|nr:hypothetical protein HNY73_010795 [Argiope bruennichi]